ncbi:odorant receptor 59a-like [Teleopsis dalmanni]|uniref:odorant receptor 59a-like n=1 Tax=Teleopsis dalmanni TaxID=139649 RepID=UPI0018CD8352|nr:odorant receptor 59a-like [Teleopsis dalmanni]
MESVSSTEFLKPLWSCWKILGVARLKVEHKRAYLLYGILFNIAVTIYYPTHLLLSMFRNQSLSNDIKNFGISITCVACSLKITIYAIKLHRVQEMEAILQQLDKRIQSADERKQFQTLRNDMRNIAYSFLIVYFPCIVTGAISVLFKDEWSLLYPAWFPFNWRESISYFLLANLFQIVGISFQLLQNYVDDCFPPMALCLLSGHIKLLSMRVSKIGYKNKEFAKNEEELRLCILDQKNLYKLFDIISNIISFPMFIQFAVTATNICLAMAAVIFYVEDPLDRPYYITYFFAMPMQIFPTCYYGSEFEYLFGTLQYAVFKSNWMDQSPKYKKHMILFTERSMKPIKAVAGGMLRIHLDTFFSTCKGAYSLFAVIIRLNSNN